MEQERIDRINVLARKSRTPEGLTEEEKIEQAALRKEYVSSVLTSLQSNLDSTYILEPDGTRHRLPRKD